MKTALRATSGLVVIFLVSAATALCGTPDELLPDGTPRPGARITVRAGQEGEFLFRPKGVRFLTGRARIVAVGKPFVDPEGREIKEFFIDVSKSPCIPWRHDEKPFRMRIHAETDFTLEAGSSWEWTPKDDYQPSPLRSSRVALLRGPRSFTTVEEVTRF